MSEACLCMPYTTHTNYTQYSHIIILLTVYTHEELMLFMTHQTHRMCSWYISLQTCGQSISERNSEERWLKEVKGEEDGVWGRGSE